MIRNVLISSDNLQRSIPILKLLESKKITTCEFWTSKKNIPLSEYKNISCKVRLIKDFKSNSLTDKIKLLNIDLIIVAGCRKIIPSKIFDTPPHGTINLHVGALPKYRGGSPLNWQIINNEENIPLSIIKMDKGIDTGQIIEQEFFKLGQNEDISIAHSKANKIFQSMVDNALKILLEKKAMKKQDEKDALYWHQRSSDDGRILWREMTSHNVHNLVRAITKPYPGAYTFINKKKVIIYKTELTNFCIRGIPGKILFNNKNSF